MALGREPRWLQNATDEDLMGELGSDNLIEQENNRDFQKHSDILQ